MFLYNQIPYWNIKYLKYEKFNMKKLLQLNIILLTLLLIFSTTRIILNNYYITNQNKKVLDILKKLNITEKYII